MRDVGRWVGDEGRRIGCQRRRGSDLKPEKTLLLLDLLPGDEPDGGDIRDTACTSLVSILKNVASRYVCSIFHYSSSMLIMNLTLCCKTYLYNISKVVIVIEEK